MRTNPGKLIPITLLAGIIIFGLHTNAVNSLNRAIDISDTGNIIFEVQTGQTASEIGDNLEISGLIKSPYAFSKYLKKNSLDSEIQAGKFILNPAMTGIEIIEILTGEATGEIVFTIPEGYTIRNIDEKLAEEELIQSGDFITCTETCDFSDYEFLPDYLEGYLFPDTFFLNKDTFSTEGFIRQLLDNFKSKITDQMLADIEKNGRTLEETIIVASMIEKEVITDKDRKMVSDIIWRRLDAGWMLGMCSTINYLTGKSEITEEDLQIDSPYNTRIYAGLPPTPISNPGLASIESAIYPESNEYWFYLTATETGETIYAVTDEEHETNKEKYLRNL